MPMSSFCSTPRDWKVVWLYAGVGRSENICLRGERRSVEAEVVEVCWLEGPSVVWSNSGPKMVVWSSTKEEINGAGTLRVGAKTMPTAIR